MTRLLLISRYPEQRLEGVKRLAKSNRTPAVEAALDQALHDVSPEVRIEAAKTLLSMQGNNSVAMQLLALYLKDGSTSLRAATALADARHSAATLADAGYQATIDLLVADLSVLPPLPAQHGTDDSFAWRPYSAAVVLRILNWGRSPAERAMLAVAEGKYETASAEGTASVKPLVDEFIRIKVVLHYVYRRHSKYSWKGQYRESSWMGSRLDDLEREITKLGHAAIDQLLNALRVSTSEIRLGATQILGRIRDPKAAPQLKELLQDEDEEIQRAASKALDEIGSY